jgi:hypothetical protein
MKTRRKFTSLFKTQKNNPPTTPHHISTQNDHDQNPVSDAVEKDSGDRRRAKARYKEAATLLEQSVKFRQGNWGSFDFQDLSGEPESLDDSQFRNKINLALATRETSIKDKSAWSKCRYTVECIFTALSPFAKNFLIIAKDGQSVLLFLSGFIVF